MARRAQPGLRRVSSQSVLTSTILDDWHHAIMATDKFLYSTPGSFPKAFTADFKKQSPTGSALPSKASAGWGKAFDKIHPDALLRALTRFGVSPHVAALIKNILIYTSPQLTVQRQGNGTSEGDYVEIRQGCPLSPSSTFSSVFTA